MRNHRDDWNLAKLLIEQHGPDAPMRAKAADELLSWFPMSRDRSSIVDLVRAMEALSMKETQTIH